MDAQDFSHKIFKNNPLLFKSYVGMEVNVLTESDDKISGIVYTVDPVSESVVLIETEKKNRVTIVLGHTIKDIIILSKSPCALPELFTNATRRVLQSSLEDRKKSVMKLLQNNRFSIKEEGETLVIENILSIKPPYESADCVCVNSIILGRIQDLLSCT